MVVNHEGGARLLAKTARQTIQKRRECRRKKRLGAICAQHTTQRGLALTIMPEPSESTAWNRSRISFRPRRRTSRW